MPWMKQPIRILESCCTLVLGDLGAASQDKAIFSGELNFRPKISLALKYRIVPTNSSVGLRGCCTLDSITTNLSIMHCIDCDDDKIKLTCHLYFLGIH